MLNATIRKFALAQLVRYTRDGGSREAIRLYWDYMYLYRHGLPHLPDAPFPGGPLAEVQRDGSALAEGLAIHEALLFNVLDAMAGDPSPQPSLSDILGNREVRLEAASALARQLEDGLKQLNQEIEWLGKIPSEQVQTVDADQPLKPVMR